MVDGCFDFKYCFINSQKKENQMRKYFFILLVCCAGFIFSVDSGYAEKKALNAAEVAQLFSNTTFNVVSENKDKETKELKTSRVYSSEMGGLRVVFDSGAIENRSWSVTDEGALCLSRRQGSRRGGRGDLCGYLVTEDNATYWLYKAKFVDHVDGRAVKAKSKKLLMTFSNFKQGNAL
jgi:hypothetical protein